MHKQYEKITMIFNNIFKRIPVALAVSVVLATGAQSAFASSGAYTWAQSTVVTSTGTPYCYTLTASTTGQYMACDNSGKVILISSDYGATFHESGSPSEDWTAVSISGSGQYVAAVDDTWVYTSNDYGATWTERSAAGQVQWDNVMQSQSGQYIMASHNNVVATSNDYGVTWLIQTLPTVNSGGLTGGAISDSGQHAIFLSFNDTPFVTNDYGVTWTPVSSLPANQGLYSAGMSGNGSYITAASITDDQVYVSNNSGTTWTMHHLSGASALWGTVVSDDGKNQVVSDDGSSSVYFSSDYGSSWVLDPTLPSGGYHSVAASKDLSRVIVQDNSGNLWYSFNPVLIVAPPATPVVPSQPASASTTTPVASTAASTSVTTPNTGLQPRPVLVPALALAGAAAIFISSIVFRQTRGKAR